MTQPFDDEYGERLRRALHAEAEAVTPSTEGLERIRAKINTKHERRLGFFSYSAPWWLRPFAAVAAALAVCVVAVSVTPGLANFVQTGHFSSDTGSDGSNSSTENGKSQGKVVPGGPANPVSSESASPTAIHPTNTGKHVVNGSACPSGEETVTPSSPASGPAATPQITCQAPPADETSPPPVTQGPPTPPVITPPEEPPSDQPTSESAPAPNQSP